jgi:hypothetical protein
MAENIFPKSLNELLNMMGNNNNLSQGSINDLITQLGNNDPRFKIITDYFEKQRTARTVQDSEKEERRRRAGLRIQQLKEEYKILVERNNILASALGACQFCWGTDISCVCRGQGKIASQQPDKQAFTQLVKPVLDRYGPIARNEPGNTGAIVKED